VESNRDDRVVVAFGEEWSHFDQRALPQRDHVAIFEDYFAIFPWRNLPKDGGQGADVGCGSGRWAQLVTPRVRLLHCVDASREALEVAQTNLAGATNVRFHLASVNELPFADGVLDFAYSLGVLHHLPDTLAGIKSIASKLRGGAPFLVYLYYAFDDRPVWFKILWRLSDMGRRAISRMPFLARYLLTQVLAMLIYWPLSRVARWLDRRGQLPATWPLAYYRDKSFYVMRTDALDRFGTRLERRFTRRQIRDMLQAAGFGDIHFSEKPPFWCAVGIKQ
jgi:SAM-dependent methyltransferase